MTAGQAGKFFERTGRKLTIGTARRLCNMARKNKTWRKSPAAILAGKTGTGAGPLEILFIRQDRIGDVLISTPLFAAVKKRYPDAQIDVVLGGNNYFALDGNPDIRSRIVYRKSPATWPFFLTQLRRRRYDFVFDLLDNPSATSTMLTLLARADCRVGLEKENDSIYDVKVPLLSRRDYHITERIAQMLSVLNIHATGGDLRAIYRPSQDSRAFAKEFLEKSGWLKPGGTETGGHTAPGYLALNISAGSAARWWGVEKYSALVRSLLERMPNLKILVLSDPNDAGKALEIVLRGGGRVPDSGDTSNSAEIIDRRQRAPRLLLGPRTKSFDQFAALVEPASALFTPDTAAVHLASAYGIPAVVIYVHFNKNLRIWDPYGVPCEAITVDEENIRNLPEPLVLERTLAFLVKYPGR